MDDIAKPKTLRIAKKLLSLLGKLEITDDDDIVYECAAQWRWFKRSWRITQNGVEVAFVRQKLLSFAPIWDVRTNFPSK